MSRSARRGWEVGDDQEQAFYVDSGLLFDGSVPQTLQPGAGATVKGTTGVTFTAGGSVFTAGDVGCEISTRYFDYSETDPEDPAKLGRWKTAKAKITGYTSATVVTATDPWRLARSDVARRVRRLADLHNGARQSLAPGGRDAEGQRRRRHAS
jgi:hypothetical protein